MSVDDKLLDQKEDEIEEEKEEDSEKISANGSDGDDDEDSTQDGGDASYKVGEESSEGSEEESSEASDEESSESEKDAPSKGPKEPPPKIPRSKMERLNDKTRKRLSEVDTKDLNMIKKLHQVFKGYKVGNESFFLEEKTTLKDKVQNVSSKSLDYLDTAHGVIDDGVDIINEGSGIANDPSLYSDTSDTKEDESNELLTAEKFEKLLGAETNSIGIAASVITILKAIKDLYSAKPIKSEQKKDSESDECEEDVDDFGVNSADNKYQMIEATFTIVEEVSSYLGNFAEIPGVSLILNGIRTIIDIVRARRANKARIRMNDNRRLFKEKYLNKGTDDKAMVKEMGKYKSLLKFWKRTNITVDIKTMEKRLDELNASGDDSEPVKEEKEDIMKFLTQERIRDVSKSKRISSMLSFMGDLPKTILSLSTLVGFPFASIISSSAGIISTAGGHKDDYTRKKTKAKASKYTQYLIEIIGNLPDTTDAQEDKIKYVEANDMVESTGLDTLKLKNTIAEGKMQTFNMFVELLGG